MIWLLIVLVAAAGYAAAQPAGYPGSSPKAAAQNFPLKPVRLVVGFAPGGGADSAARSVAQKLNEVWGQSVIIDNRAGAGGNVATEIVARAAPDGYTLLISSPGPIVTNPFLYARLPYDPQRDLAPVTLIASSVNLILVNPSAPVSNVRELIAWARSKPGGVNYASSGIGSTPHLAGELLKAAAHIDMVHVAYKSAAPAVIDLIGGRVDVMLASLPTSLAQVKAQRLKAIAVASLKRSAALPEVPTADESGVPGYEVVTWWGMLAPAGVPGNLITKINQIVVKNLKSPEMKESLARDGAEAIGNSPAEFGAFIQKESAKWSKVIKTSGVKIE
jgi:tripartite-type tricarboxylate transporter receptor subunit TctC